MIGRVSIIIPVYNVDSKYMNICMDSIGKQTYTDLEILLIDDGSNTETKQLCVQFAENDKRIKVVHQNNQGVSAARNNGTSLASGEYIMYVDADDILVPYAIEEGIDYLNRTGSDMVIAAVKKIKPGDAFETDSDAERMYDVFGQDGTNIDVLRHYYMMMDDPKYKKMGDGAYIGRGPWSRLIKSDIAKANKFPVGMPLGEDIIWNMQFTNLCDKICVLSSTWYGYVIYNSSSMRKYYGGKREELVRKYLDVLWDNNKKYCVQHKEEFAKNAAMEFYCILKYELLSEKCKLLFAEKNEKVKEWLELHPWSLMVNKSIFYKMPIKYKIMITLCKMNLWQLVIRLI